MEIVTQIIQILVAGFSEMATGIGTGLNDFAQGIFLNAEGTLSYFGTLIIAFGAVALAIGLSKFVVNWLTSFGR